jgi:hypothetical protein
LKDDEIEKIPILYNNLKLKKNNHKKNKGQIKRKNKLKGCLENLKGQVLKFRRK